MIRITVHPPRKTPHEYLFLYEIEGGGAGTFGITTETFEIPHDPLWDTLYPLMWLTRNGGPVFGEHDEVRITLAYPVLWHVIGVMEDRAKRQGINTKVYSPTVTETAGCPSFWPNVVGFGGGKESSLICGMARELGLSPQMMMGTMDAGRQSLRWPWEDISFFKPVNKGVTDRLILQMMCGNTVYHGAGLGDTWRSDPWTQYYDIGSQEGWNQFNDMFARLGVNRRVIVPLQCVPFAQVPRILCERYPDIAVRRRSTDRRGKFSEKNLHVTLCEMVGDVPYDMHCTPAILCQLVESFVARGDDFGFRNSRRLVHLEIRAMLWHLRDSPELAPVRHLITDVDWCRSWPWMGHYYHQTPTEFEEIIREYLPSAPDGTACDGGVWLG